ncbi:hypothetical protein ACV3RC_06050 [Clostridium perfringens]
MKGKDYMRKEAKKTSMLTIRCTPELKGDFIEVYKKAGLSGTQVLEEAMRKFIEYVGENC